jgi:RecA-family ATPase
MAHLPERVNSWSDQSIRRALAPLHRMAEENHCAVLVVAHLNKTTAKDPTYRAGGSIALPAAARSGLLLGRDPDDEEGDQGSRRVLAQFKSNYGKFGQSLAYCIEPGNAGLVPTSRIVQVGTSHYTAAELLKPPDEEERSALAEAISFLETELETGERLANEVKKEARALGISERTLTRVRKETNVRARKDGKAWVWSLPSD